MGADGRAKVNIRIFSGGKSQRNNSTNQKNAIAYPTNV